MEVNLLDVVEDGIFDSGVDASGTSVHPRKLVEVVALAEVNVSSERSSPRGFSVSRGTDNDERLWTFCLRVRVRVRVRIKKEKNKLPSEIRCSPSLESLAVR